MINNNYFGINLQSSTSNTISGNVVRNNKSDGIKLSSSSNNTISGNTVENNNLNGTGYGGLYIVWSSYPTISNNTVRDNSGYGIFIYQSSSYTILSGNIVENNSFRGIYLASNSNNTLSGNTVKNDGADGISLNTSPHNILSGNTVENNLSNGIYLYRSDNNTITNNTVGGNAGKGIDIDYPTNNCTIYHNLIYGNATNAYDYSSPANAWDNGSEGNWWGDWQWGNGLVDTNNDGIFENQRLITGSIYDRYPLAFTKIIGPDNGTVFKERVISLRWSRSVMGSYALEIDDSSDFSSPVVSLYGLTGESYTTSSLTSEKYYWRVKASSAGLEEPFWAAGYFTILRRIVNFSPEVPSNPNVTSISLTGDSTQEAPAVIVTVSGEAPTGVLPLEEKVITYLEISSSDLVSAGVRITLSPESLENLDPDSVVVYHWSGGSWKALPTQRVGERTYEFTVDGFSWFAVTGRPLLLCQLNISISPPAGGSVIPGSGFYMKGSLVTLRALPSPGYIFSGWGGDASGYAEEITVVMDSDRNIAAYFSLAPEQSTTPAGGTNFSPLAPGLTPPAEDHSGEILFSVALFALGVSVILLAKSLVRKR